MDVNVILVFNQSAPSEAGKHLFSLNLRGKGHPYVVHSAYGIKSFKHNSVKKKISLSFMKVKNSHFKVLDSTSRHFT